MIAAASSAQLYQMPRQFLSRGSEKEGHEEVLSGSIGPLLTFFLAIMSSGALTLAPSPRWWEEVMVPGLAQDRWERVCE